MARDIKASIKVLLKRNGYIPNAWPSMAQITGIGKFSKSYMNLLAFATAGPTASGGMVCLSLRSAPAQNMPGVVLRNIITLALVSNFTASTASHNCKIKFLLNEFLAYKK